MNKILVLLVFSHQQNPCTWSLPCLYEHNILRAKCEGVDPPNSISESSEPPIMMHTKCHQLLLLMLEQGGRTSQEKWTCQTKIKFKIKTGLTKEGDITIRSVITRIFIFRTNWGTRSMNFIRRSLVQRTYNTEPSPKELAWGEALLCIQVSILSLHFSFQFLFN